MGGVRFAVVIAHADFMPERCESVKPIREAVQSAWTIFEITGKKTVRQRAEAGWFRAAAEDAVSHALFLDDDITLCPDFIEHVAAAVEARPNAVISFFSNHSASGLAVAKSLSWVATLEGLTGQAWAIPIPALREFLAWRAEALTPEALDAYPDDAQVCLWLLATGRRCFHTIPSLVDHRTDIKSTWGADNQNVNRRAVVPPRADMSGINWRTGAVPLGRVYARNHWDLIKQTRPEWRQRSGAALKAYAAERAGCVTLPAEARLMVDG